eukprot:jgi/Mesvir1/13399/Mv25621-RA.2
MEETSLALQHLKTGSAPGADGLPVEFFKTFWPLIGRDLYQCILEIWNTETVVGQWSETILILLHKKGDKTSWKNYRPIRMLTVPYKLASKLLQRRFYSVLDNLIGPEQVGFRSNLHISDSITMIMDIVDDAWRNNIIGLILFWDFEKAFDRICWKYLEAILHGLGFGPKLIKVSLGMIKSLTWHLLINGHKSHIGHSTRSLPQGDCLSPLLFLLAHAGLFFLHQQDSRIQGYPLPHHTRGLFQTAYADDTTNICTSLRDVDAVLDNISTYCTASQQRCNVQKSTGLHIGRTTNPTLQPTNLAVTWVPPGGYHLLHNCPIGRTAEGRLLEVKTFLYDESQQLGKLTGVQQVANRWAGVHRLSLRGKVLVTNQLLFSKLLYFGQAHPPDEHTVSLIQRLGHNFVWKKSSDLSRQVHGWIRESMSFMPWPLGGLGLHNMQWRLWSVYAKQVISAHIGVNTHPGCLLARVTLSRLTHHSNGISWHSGAALLTARLPSPKLTRGLPWYWARIWQGFMALKPDRLLFPTLREEVARQPLFFNDIYLNPLNRPFGCLSGPNPYEGFITSPHPVTTILHLYILHGDCYRLLTYNELAAWVPNIKETTCLGPQYAYLCCLGRASTSHTPPLAHTHDFSPCPL